MLKNPSFTKSTPAQIEELQRRYARLKTEQKLNRVDIYDAEHGGGYDALSQAMAEKQDIDAALEGVEGCLQEEGVTPLEEIPFSNCETQQEVEKLRRYNDIFIRCDVWPLPIMGE